MAKNALNITNLKIKYASGFQLGPIEIDAKELTVGIVGRNGAGKTTLFQILTGHLKPDHGEVFILGQTTYNNPKFKKNIGYLPQEIHLPPWVSARDLLEYASGLYDIKNHTQKIKEMTDYWELGDFQNRAISQCSHGMQKRIGLALATIHSPDFLIIDEPFAGLDVQHIATLKKMINDRQSQGKMTIVSSHILPYISELCTGCIVIKNGQSKILEKWGSQDTTARTSQLERLVLG